MAVFVYTRAFCAIVSMNNHMCGLLKHTWSPAPAKGDTVLALWLIRKFILKTTQDRSLSRGMYNEGFK